MVINLENIKFITDKLMELSKFVNKPYDYMSYGFYCLLDNGTDKNFTIEDYDGSVDCKEILDFLKENEGVNGALSIEWCNNCDSGFDGGVDIKNGEFVNFTHQLSA